MHDIKEVITILCKYLNDTVDSTLTPEHFRLAKYDKSSEDVINSFWATLDKLTYFALKELNDTISFNDFDKCMRTKFRLAYLQYPCLEIYSFSTHNSRSRVLMVALTWLITKYNVLGNVVRLKLLDSSLGREFSKVSTDSAAETNDAKLSTVSNQMNNLLIKAHKLSNNLKAISELNVEKVKLMTRVHAASITTSGLPHLTVSEMALIKNMAVKKNNNEAELLRIKEMEQTASMLDTSMKWSKKSHVFHTWMNTVLDECEKIEEPIFSDEASTQLARFIYLLRHIIKRQLKSFKNHDHRLPFINSIQDCPSRLLRVQKCITEAHACLSETNNRLDIMEGNLVKKRTDLEIELKSVLSLIPNCVQV
ncbi:uncharacterized protein LOC100679754 [Nasonia vitripennis]|uniref:Tubulin epsilon and delta complex protein 1 domain-containing protein n=1 Tax=Nasonia vitripennis TaxID=7425 RepID=A0A7M7GJ99_NASVI|nr:uncharacterized protein LOC100679754 [Nasonia vitripennis]